MLLTKTINHNTYEKIKLKYREAKKRLIFLDYDGTLVSFKNQVNAAIPDEELMQLLKALTKDPKNINNKIRG